MSLYQTANTYYNKADKIKDLKRNNHHLANISRKNTTKEIKICHYLIPLTEEGWGESIFTSFFHYSSSLTLLFSSTPTYFYGDASTKSYFFSIKFSKLKEMLLFVYNIFLLE